VSLAEARAARDATRNQLTRDIDPMAERKAAKLARQLSAENSFAAVARRW